MQEPSIKIGFIIFNQEWKQELEWCNGHRNTALKWIRDNNLMKAFLSVVGKNNIYDEEDFLIDYIGAVKLYAYNGKFYCRIPRMIDVNKSYLKRYFRSKGYKIVGECYEEDCHPKAKTYKYPYNKTVINEKNRLCYNPYRDGD